MKVISIVGKDLKIILSDKKALAIIIVMPLILTLILSSALKGSMMEVGAGDIYKISIAVVKQYDGKRDQKKFDGVFRDSFVSPGTDKSLGKELETLGDDVDPEKIFFEDFLDSKEVSRIIEYRIEEKGRALELLRGGEISAVILLPEEFIYNMKVSLLTPFRNNVNIEVVTHPDRIINGQVVKSIAEAYSDVMSSAIAGKNTLIEAAMAYGLKGDNLAGVKTAMEKMSSEMGNIKIDIKDVIVEGRKKIGSFDYYSAAIMTMFMLFAASHGGRMLLEEKDNITYQRMIIAGTPKLSILAGKFFTVFVIALLQIGVMIMFSHFVLKVGWGNTPAVLYISLSAAFAVAGIGCALAAATYRAGNYKMADIFETAVLQTMALLGGSFFPIEVLPSMLQKLSFLSVNGIALRAYLRIMRGYGTAGVISNIMILSMIGILFILLSIFILKGDGGIRDVQHNKTEIAEA